MKKALKLLFISTVMLAFSCSTSKETVPDSTPMPTSPPIATPVETIYDKVYYNKYAGGYETYMFFDYDSNSGVIVTKFYKRHGSKPKKWGVYENFTFEGNFDEGLYISRCGSNDSRCWMWFDGETYIAPKDEFGFSYIDAHREIKLDDAITYVRKHGIKDQVGCE